MTNAGNQTGAYTGGIPLNVTLHAWPIPKPEPEVNHFTDRTNPGVTKSSESAKNYTYGLHHNLNATGYVAIDDDLTDTGFTDVQTVILTGIATVILLLIAAASVLVARCLWRRYAVRKGDGYEGVLQKEESSEPVGKLRGHSIPHEVKTSESQFTVTPGEDPTSSPSPSQLLTPKSNGSVITMTLKNNHLIVETEETENTPTGIKIESKGTMTKFVTSAAPDFRTEIGSDGNSSCDKGSGSRISARRDAGSDDASSSTDHGALVHHPPEEPEDEPDRSSRNTGLSQSDLSLSSIDSQNPSYRYGNQMGYDSGGYGYPEYSGYSTYASDRPRSHPEGPKERKTYARSSSVAERSDDSVANGIETTMPPRLQDILSSDVQAREARIAEDEEKRYQEEQRRLGNGDASVQGDKSEALTNERGREGGDTKTTEAFGDGEVEEEVTVNDKS